MVVWLFGCGLAPSAQLGDLTVRSLTLEGATAELAVVVDNPWPVGSAVDAQWAFVVDGDTVASGAAEQLSVASRDVSTVVVPITWRWSDLWRAAGAVGEAVPYRAELLLSGAHTLGAWELPLAVEGTLPALTLPTLDVFGWRVDEVTPWRLAGAVLIGVGGALPVTDLTWSATLGGRLVAHGAVAVAEGTLALPVVIELAAFPEAVWYATEKGGSLAVDGGVETALGRLPVRYALAWSPR